MPIHCKSLDFAQSISISLGYTFSYWNAVLLMMTYNYIIRVIRVIMLLGFIFQKL